MDAPIVIFDLDGTLIDSVPDIHAAASRLLEAEGCTPLPLATIRSFIGHGVPALIDQIIAVAALDCSKREQLIAMFLEDYNANAAVLTTLFPGVLDCLEFFKNRGFKLGVCTNKPLEPTLAILNAFGISDRFDTVVGGDCFPSKKPDPEGLNSAILRLGGGPALYVGDSAVDAKTASRANVLFGLFSGGYLNADINDVRYTFRFASFEELPPLTEEVFGHQGVFV